MLLMGQLKSAKGEDTGDVHAQNGCGRVNISLVKLFGDVGLGVGDQVEGIGYGENVVHIDESEVNAIDGVVYGVQDGVGGGAPEAKGGESGVEQGVPLSGSLFEAVDAFEHAQDAGSAVRNAFGLTHKDIFLKISVHEGRFNIG
jgi:hypothetical protein